MKKVLIIVYTPTFGGPHNQITELKKPLEARGWKTVALLPETDDESYNKLLEREIKVVQKPLLRLRASKIFKNNLNYMTAFRENIDQIVKVIKEENVDVVQVCGLMHIHAAFACQELGIPLVWQFLGTFAPLPLRILYTPFAAKKADWIMTTGMRTAKQHVFHSLFKKKHTVFYPPVDTQKFTFSEEKKTRARKWMDVPSDAFLVGTVGNQNKTKGHEYFVDVAEKLSSEQDYYFRIIGKHTPSHARYYEERVINRARNKKLFDKGKFDILEDELPVDTIMSAFDVFLLTSRIEGMPTVVLEAMSLGLPIVSSDVGSIREVIAPRENGFIYQKGGVSKAVEYINLIYNNNEISIEIAHNNCIKANSDFDSSVCADKHIVAYENAIRNRKA